jgi:hypothetical protein
VVFESKCDPLRWLLLDDSCDFRFELKVTGLFYGKTKENVPLEVYCYR